MVIDKGDGARGGGAGASPSSGGMYSDQHLRVSDAEREAVSGRLAEHFAAGRLDQAEFDDRVGRAMSAKTRGDLRGLFADLSETGAPAVPELPRGGGGTPGGGTRGPGSPIEFRLDAASGVPTYLQLVHQVEHALRLGYLTLGDQLPKVRDVVASLAINPNTVLKAYKELETKGLTAGRPGQGTFIQATLEPGRAPGARPRCAAPCSAGWAPRTGPGWTRTGSWRCSPARCGISMSAAAGHAPAAARRAAKRRASHERRRGQRPGQALRRHLGAARVHAGGPGRARGRAGRPERRGQDHAAEPGGRPGGTDRGRRDRARRQARRVPGRAGRHRVRRPGHAAVQEPLGRGHAAPDPQPEPALRPALRGNPAGRARHPAEPQGREAVRRPAGAARADPGAGPPAAAAGAR